MTDLTQEEIESIRQEFPILDQKIYDKQALVYLDSAATSQTPQRVIDSLIQFYRQDHANIHRGIHCLAERSTRAYEGARQKVADFIGASQAEEIIFTSGTTAGLNFLARGLVEPQLKPGDVILTSQLEHHSNLVPWQAVAQRTGATLKYFSLDEHYQVDLQATDGQAAKFVVIQHVSNVLGVAQDIAAITAWAHEQGMLVIVDGAQAVAHGQVDVQALGVDAYCFSGHKMFGPTGVGVCYLKSDHHDRCQPVNFGGEMIHRVGLYQSDYKQAPWKFEAGTQPIAQVIGLGQAIEWIQEVGLARMEAYVEALTQYLLEGLLAIEGVTLYGPGIEDGLTSKRASGLYKDQISPGQTSPGDAVQATEPASPSFWPRNGIIAYNIEGVHPHDAATAYDVQGIAIRAGHHCAQPLMDLLACPACLRASLMVYNTYEEVDKFIQATQAVKEFFLR